MSKSLGNSPDPIELIGKYGADGVRVGMLLTSPAGNDLPFDDSLCEQGRNFSNKIWNALRLVKGWEVDETIPQPESCRVSVLWFNARMQEAIGQLNEHYERYKLSDALMAVYKLIWDDFCSWYLEMIKPAFQKPIDKTTLNETISIFEKLMQLLHPFMPFITEEIWHILRERNAHESIMLTAMPQPTFNENDPFGEEIPVIIQQFAFAEEVVIAVRNARKEMNLPMKECIELFIRKNNNEMPDTTFDGVVSRLCNISEIAYVENKVEGAISFIIRATEFYIPMSANIDKAAEIARLSEELKYTEGFLQSVIRKLSNERFVANAKPEVVDIERHKQADAEAKMNVIKEQIAHLRS
jgi:valyl-tRNA synthetase